MEKFWLITMAALLSIREASKLAMCGTGHFFHVYRLQPRFIGGIKYDRKEKRAIWNVYFLCPVVDVNELEYAQYLKQDTEKMIQREF